ncbi:transglycosylase domain-containing protein [Egicoccus sp. AB-alg6-2]|uniref:transglycosylase domain-containing protein n=1 Tax=Egicoccus sp. AB-alg6-2 TaxID=3242692 RepID=UPI00359D0D19
MASRTTPTGTQGGAAKRSTPRGRQTATKKPWYRRWWIGLLVLPAIFLGALALLVFYLVFSSVPLPGDIAADASVVYDKNGAEIGGFAGPDQATREDIDLAAIPDHVGHAVLGVEDRDFYEHRGVSVTGVGRALFTNVRAGSVQQGGSTITQQYIKNAAVGADQTYTRKVQEAALALKLEQAYEKDEILEFYLNTIYWGRGAYGIQAAARSYFDVPASELTINQSATLAGIIASPENFDPHENPERAEARRRVSLAGMLEKGWIDQATHDELRAAGLPEVIERRGIELGPNAYFLDGVRRELSTIPEFAAGELFRGFRIHTELDPRMQRLAQATLTQAVGDGPTDTGAIVTVDPATGGVRALVGGPDFGQQPRNDAYRSARQVGSTFKAFTLQAFLEAGFSPESRFPAPAELDVSEPDDDEPVFIRNFGGSDPGEQTVLQATASSTNTVYYQMQEEAGRERTIDAARRAGLPVSREVTQDGEVVRRDTMAPVRSLTLGVHSFTPLEMAGAFATYAAEGTRIAPRLVSRVETADGRVVYEAPDNGQPDVDIEVARAVTQALRGVVDSGSGQAAQLGRPTAGKTGTTQNSQDAWFVGYIPQLATAVWLGNADNTPIEGEATGGGLAAPVWGEYMSRAIEGLEVVDFTAPDLDLELLNEELPECPEGYAFADPPAGDADPMPDVLSDVTNADGQPCVEQNPEPEPEPEPECPPGYAFADPPAGDADPMPDVLSDVTNADGQPCVEQNPEPEPEPEPTEEPEPEPTEPEPEPEPTVTLPVPGPTEPEETEGGGEGDGGSGDGDGDEQP